MIMRIAVFFTFVFLFKVTAHTQNSNQNLLDSAISAYERQDLEHARLILTEYLTLDSVNSQAYYYMGMIKSRDFLFGGFEEFNMAIQLDSNHVGALMARGNYYSYSGDYELALLDYKRANRLAPNDMGLLMNLASSRYDNGDVSGALENYAQVIKSTGPYKEEGLVERGLIYCEQGYYQEAIVDLELAIKNRSFFCNTYECLGDCYSKIGNKDRACHYWEMVISRFGSSGGECQSVIKKIEEKCRL